MLRFISTSLYATLALIGFSAVTFASPDDLKKSTDAKTEALPKGIARHLGKVELDRSHVQVHKRAALAHKPLEMIDPKTGKKVTADATIELPNGKKVNAGEYFAELNKLERKFNELGYTLNDRSGGKVVLQESKIDRSALESHGHTLARSHQTFAARTMKAVPTHETMLLKQADFRKVDAIRLQGLAKLSLAPTDQAKTSQASKQWNYAMGNKSIVAAYLSGKLEIKGSKDEVSALAEARAGGYVINREINVIKANGSVRAPAKGQSKASLHVYLLGQHVVNLEKTGTAAWQTSGVKQHGIDVKADFHFSIGPIPMVAHLGARGNAGVRYTIAARPAHASFQVSPFVDAKVYVKAGVDFGIASGGGGGEVTLLKDDLNIGADLDIHFDAIRGPSLSEHFYVQNKMNMLSGKVYAWAKINYLIGSKEWHYDLWNWKGLQTSGYLINVNRTQYLIPNFQSVAQQAVTPAMAK